MELRQVNCEIHDGWNWLMIVSNGRIYKRDETME